MHLRIGVGMASIRKAGGKWLAEVRIKGLNRSKTFLTKIEAQSWALELEKQHGKHGGIVTGRTLGDAFDKYAEEESIKKKGERWETIRLKKLRRSWIADIQLMDLRPDDLQKWVLEQGETLSSASINRELNLISAVLSVARKRWKWMHQEVTRDVDRPQAPPPRDRRISQAEINRILTALEFEEGAPVTTQRQMIAVAFLLALETAMRQGELWGLDWQDVYLREQYVRLQETKNGSRRDVALSLRAVALLKMLEPKAAGRVFTIPKESSGQLFRRAVQLAEIKGLTFHDTRHEALTRLAQKLQVLDLARMVGHRDPRSLMIYYNAKASEIAAKLG